MPRRTDPGIATQREAAAYLRISVKTLRRWEQAGKGPQRIPGTGRRALYRWTAVRAWTRGQQAAALGVVSDPGED
jgi:predicted site-specific integrase-resolvase